MGDVTVAHKPRFISKKRPPASDAEIYERKIKRIRQRLQLGSPIESNAVMVLNDYDKDLKYELVEQVGPIHNPSFTVQLVVNGQMFSGTSNSKKKAKLLAAESAVQALLGEPPDIVASTPSRVQMKMETEMEEPSCRGMNPTVVLNEIRHGTTYDAVVPDDPTETVVTNGKPVNGMVCVIDGQKFEGCGTNKKMSKALAADAALRKLFGIQCIQLPDGSPVYAGDTATLAAVKQKFGTPTRAGPAKITVIAPSLVVDLPGGKNPVSLLYELYSGTGLTIDDMMGYEHHMASDTPGVFVARVCIEEREFQGKGTNKKAARTAAATAAVNYLHQSGLLSMKLSAKEVKRKQQAPWQPKQRPQFSQNSEYAGTKSTYGQARGRGRGRGRILARNQAWVSGGTLNANDFLGLHPTSAQDQSQFSADLDYTQLAESARNFAAASSTHGYDMYANDYHGYMHGASAQDAGQAYGQQGQKKDAAANSSNSVFTAYGSYTTPSSTSQMQTSSQAGARGRGRGIGRGFGSTRGGGAAQSASKTPASAVGGPSTYRPRFGGASDVGYGIAVGATSAQLMQPSSQPVSAEQYATESYTSAVGQQQQQLYENYPGYDYADSNAAYSQAAYYTTTGGQYRTTDTGLAQYYSQF